MTVSVSELRAEVARLSGRWIESGLQRPVTVEAWKDRLKDLSGRGWLAPGDALPTAAHAAMVLETLAGEGVDVGVPLTLTVNYAVGFCLLARLRPQALEPLRRGEGFACLSASEPKVGSHPGKILTRAERTGRGRDLGVFVVPRGTPGVTISSMDTLPGLECSLHGAVKLEGAELPADARLGPEGPKANGWTAIVKPFRTWEDALMASWIAGAIRRDSRALVRALQGRSGFEYNAGRLVAAVAALSTLARDSARSLDEEFS